MPEEKFKLPKSSYEELSKIIKAYNHFKEPASLEEVSKLVGIHSTGISGNSGFLLEIDVLQPGARKVLTSKGRELARALEHEMPDEIRNRWRQIVMECEFIAKLVSAVKIRKGMDEATLTSHIAYSAGQPKKPQFMTGARTVIDILRGAELIVEQDGKFTVTDSEGNTAGASDKDETPPPQSAIPGTEPVVLPLFSQKSSAATSAVVNLNIEIKVSCALEDLEILGSKLRKLVSEIHGEKQQEVDTNPDSDEQ